MNHRITDLLRGFCVLISDISIAGLLLVLIPLDFAWDYYAALPLWIGLICLQFLISYLLLSIGTSVNLYLIFNGAAMTGICWLVLMNSHCMPGWDNMKWFMGMFAAMTALHAAWAAWRLPESNLILRYVDLQVILLAFYLYTEYRCGHRGEPIYTLLPPGSMLLNLFVVNRLRTGGEQNNVIQGAGAGGKLLLILMGGGCLLLTAVIVVKGGDEVHSAVDFAVLIVTYLWSVVNLLLHLFTAVLAVIIVFFLWLLPFAPNVAQEKMEVMVQENVEAATELAGKALPLWVLQLVLALGGLALAGWILYQYRGKSLKRSKLIIRRRKVVRKSRLWTAVKELFLEWKDLAVFEMNYRRYRKTPQGLLVLAERTGLLCRLSREKRESPGEYLRRLAGCAKEETVGMQLGELAALLDRMYYGGEKGKCSSAEYQCYKQAILSLKEEKEIIKKKEAEPSKEKTKKE